MTQKSETKKSTRDALGDQLFVSGAVNKNLVVLTADLGEATRVDKFAKAYPERFLDIGIAESNMIGVAAGIAAHGKRVFCTSFAVFLTGRYDQIRTSIAYPCAPVVLVGTHAGLAIGRDGAVHQSLEDLALMRALPNMHVLQPATYNEARAMVKSLAEREKLEYPVYLRLGRQPVEEMFADNLFYEDAIRDRTIMEINPIDIDKITTADHLAIFSSGCVLSVAVECQRLLREEGYNVSLYNVGTLKPIDEVAVNVAAACAEKIITVEDHSVIGGLGSAVLEALNDETMRPVLRIGVDDTFAESGRPEALYEKYGLSLGKIKRRILAWM